MSLFTGAGGLDLGFEMEGSFETLFSNELLDPPTRTFAKNFHARHTETGIPFAFDEHVVVEGDVEKVDFSYVKPGQFDLVIGGPPCQDFSVLRGKSNRKGLEVRRGRLYSHFVRALIHVQPEAFVFENVPGLVSANEGMAYKTIRDDFQNLSLRWDEVKQLVGNGSEVREKVGYNLIFSDVVEFVRLGVPQNRKRLIIIGIRKDLVGKANSTMFSSAKNILERQLRGNDSALARFPLTPIEAFEGRVITDLQEEYARVMREYKGLEKEVSTDKAIQWKRNIWDRLTFDVLEDYIRCNSEERNLSGYSKADALKAVEWHVEMLKKLGYFGNPLSTTKYPDGSNHLPNEAKEVKERMMRIPPGENFEFVRGTIWNVKGLMSNIYRRICPLQPSPTVIAYGGGGTWNYHYERNRGRLTNRERARLQTFPDRFEFFGNEQEVRAQIGEAVPPLVSFVIAKPLANILELLDKRPGSPI